MHKPDFFVIGAPRCGTTAMCAYLAEHPAVYFSDPKEPFFFGSDFKWHITEERSDYLSLFRGVGTEHTAVGEGTVYYLFSDRAVPEILHFNPEARFVVMVRDPMEMVPSMHAQLLVAGFETVQDFADAWRIQDARSRGINVATTCPDARFLMYREWGTLGAQVARLLRRVERERVHIVVFDDFATQPAAAYASVLTFLELPPDGRTEFRNRMENRQPSKLARHAVTMRGITTLTKAKRRLGLGRAHFGLLPWIERCSIRSNFRKAPRQPLSADVRAELHRAFADDIKILSELLRRDLSHWCRAPQ